MLWFGGARYIVSSWRSTVPDFPFHWSSLWPMHWSCARVMQCAINEQPSLTARCLPANRGRSVALCPQSVIDPVRPWDRDDGGGPWAERWPARAQTHPMPRWKNIHTHTNTYYSPPVVVHNFANIYLCCKQLTLHHEITLFLSRIV